MGAQYKKELVGGVMQIVDMKVNADSGFTVANEETFIQPSELAPEIGNVVLQNLDDEVAA